MAISRATKIPRGYAVGGYDIFNEVGDGKAPTLDDAGYVAPWLPVMLQELKSNEWWVILAGRMVNVNRTLTSRDEYGNTWPTTKYSGGFAPRIVPCNSSGAVQTIVYGADDVGYTVNVDSQNNLISAAGNATATLPANAPCGWLAKNAYSGSVLYTRRNYEVDLNVQTLYNRLYIEVALIGLTGQSSLAPGTLVKPFTSGTLAKAGNGIYQGCPTYWDPSSDSVEQIGGRVIAMAEVPSGVSSRERSDLTLGVQGLSLPGADTTGRPSWLSGAATSYCRINITLLG